MCILVCLCGYVHLSTGACPQKPKGVRSPGARVTGSSDPTNKLGTKLGFSLRVGTLLATEFSILLTQSSE